MVVVLFINVFNFYYFVGLPLLIMEFTVGKWGERIQLKSIVNSQVKMAQCDWVEREFSSFYIIWFL